MRRTHTLLLMLVVVAVAVPVAAGDMALGRSTGDLYRVHDTERGIAVTQTTPDGTVTESVIPQTAELDPTSLGIVVHEASGSVYVVWQRNQRYLTSVDFAALIDGTWAGPYTLAGNALASARNPQMLTDTVTTEIEIAPTTEDEEPTTETVTTTFLHLVWWSHVNEDDPGVAYFGALPLLDGGMPAFEEFAPQPLADLLPYGIGCGGIGDDATNLTFPKLFIDPDSGNPHVLATDFSECLFQIIRILYEVEDRGEEFTGTKRRRHITVYRVERTIAVNPQLKLAGASAEVGHDLSIVLHWDTEDAVDYMQLTQDDASEVRTLKLDGLSHEEAVDLIRSLAR
jgi:hypothetical protein